MQDYRIIAVIGDSIVNGYWDEEEGGWFNRLSVRLKREKPYAYTFCNMSRGGDKSIDTYYRLLGEAAGRSLDTVLIAVGVNDISVADGEPQMSARFRARSWEKIVSYAKLNFKKVMVFGMLPVIDGEIMKTGVFIYNKDVEAYNAEIKKWCESAGVAFYSPYEDCKHWGKEMYADAVHPNAKGHAELERLIYQQLKKQQII